MTTVNMVYPTTAMAGGTLTVTTDSTEASQDWPACLDTVILNRAQDTAGTVTIIPFHGVTHKRDIIRCHRINDSRASGLLASGADRVDLDVKEAGNYVLANSTSSIINLTGFTTVGSSFLYGCSKLTTLTLPEALTTVGISFLSNCSSLTTLTLPEALTSAGDYFLNGCSKLTTLTLPEALTTVGASFLNGCSSLTTLTIKATNVLTPSSVGTTAALTTIRVPASLVDSYKSASVWSSRADMFTAIEDAES